MDGWEGGRCPHTDGREVDVQMLTDGREVDAQMPTDGREVDTQMRTSASEYSAYSYFHVVCV